MRRPIQFFKVSQTLAFLLIASLGFALPKAGDQSEARQSQTHRTRTHLAQTYQTQTSEEIQPSAVSGESWLRHLGRSFDDTSMGKTGRLGPPENVSDEETAAEGFTGWQLETVTLPGNAPVVLHGADLYRMNCRGCHGESGTGAPPEINSVINPARATSAEAVMERVKATGADMSRADAMKLAQQSRTMLLDRLHHGGQDMPSFPHLNEAEINSLIAYLRLLSGVHGAAAEQLAVREERVRIGEHIAKSTCHVCHSAMGANPTAQQLYSGAIPPLSSLVQRTSREQFIRKVTHGAPITMGVPPQVLRGRMPVFYYLSQEEADDVYLYLTHYPPDSLVVAKATTAGLQPETDGPAKSNPDTQLFVDTTQPILNPSSLEGRASSRPLVSIASDGQDLILALLLGLLATLVMAVGFWFTVWELRRLSGEETVPIFGRKANAERSRAHLDPEVAA